jgi:hypothetical protein
MPGLSLRLNAKRGIVISLMLPAWAMPDHPSYP